MLMLSSLLLLKLFGVCPAVPLLCAPFGGGPVPFWFQVGGGGGFVLCGGGGPRCLVPFLKTSDSASSSLESAYMCGNGLLGWPP